jgi:hypothetical protein
MNNEHLTDDHIQEILDAQAPGAAPFLPWHLKTCRRCRERFAAYRNLYSGLAMDPGYSLRPGFADSVLAEVPAAHAALLKDPIVWIGGTGALALLVVLAFFVDWRPLAAGSASVWAAVGQAFRPLAGDFRMIVSGLGASARPFLAGGLGLLGAALVERLLRRQHMRHSH